MSRKTSAFFAFTWPVIFFLTVLGFAVLFAGPACGADDLADLTARLEAQNAAARPADPFAANNGTRTTCGCKGDLTLCNCAVKDCACPGCGQTAKGAGGCHCRGDQCHHDCEGYCNDITCPFRPVIDAPKVGARKVTDDPSRPWTYAYGDEYGYGHELGWYRHAATRPVYSFGGQTLSTGPVFKTGFNPTCYAPAFGGGACRGGS